LTLPKSEIPGIDIFSANANRPAGGASLRRTPHPTVVAAKNSNSNDEALKFNAELALVVEWGIVIGASRN
jgi:hypothetical protein